MPELSYREAVRDALSRAMRDDEDVLNEVVQVGLLEEDLPADLEAWIPDATGFLRLALPS